MALAIVYLMDCWKISKSFCNSIVKWGMREERKVWVITPVMLALDNVFLCYLFQGTIIFQMPQNQMKKLRKENVYTVTHAIWWEVFKTYFLLNWIIHGWINGEGLSHLRGLVRGTSVPYSISSAHLYLYHTPGNPIYFWVELPTSCPLELIIFYSFLSSMSF